ncbi:DNA primase [Candidatus Acetothermia bacterium]|jgi:DNA primase|nr:DNA primase [Candidatus Acetothermia bacterium]MCI2426994.1 DNA primase [Candidatus Acetothermia bacterium]MCI2428436.1 DNA primase [Candidatus Acetothermia bacterium]
MGKVDVQLVKEKVDIIGFMSRYLSLTESGEGYKGRCPFHQDKTPSFVVNPQKGLWHCFGCGEGGDIFAFLMKTERISFSEALARLAQEAGIRLRAPTGERAKLLEANQAAERFFIANLLSPAGQEARRYLLNRGYQRESWQRFAIGYALPSWDALKSKLTPHYPLQRLVSLGVIVQANDGHTYDRFRNRIIFPIHDVEGKTIGFAGRVLVENDAEPKYINTPKTALFDKGRHLYGLAWVRKDLTKNDPLILVEGHTDVISLHLHGISTAIGSMGTALTQSQADLIARFTDTVIIAYDQDAAGSAASLRGMQILRNRGLEVRIASFPPGEDPDTLIKSQGREQFQAIIDRALPFHLFYVQGISARFDLSTITGKEKALEEVRPFYHEIDSLPLREELIFSLANLLHVPRDGLRADLARKSRHRPVKVEEKKEQEWGPQEVLIALLLQGAVTWEKIHDRAIELASQQEEISYCSIGPMNFSSRYHQLIKECIAAEETDRRLDLTTIFLKLDEESARIASHLALTPVEFDDVNKALTDALVGLIHLPSIEERLITLKELITAKEERGEKRELVSLQREYHSLSKQRTKYKSREWM